MEQWRDIPGYDGIYQVSNFGNVRTCEGKTTYTERHGIRKWKQRVMKQKTFKNSHGRSDSRVVLWKEGKQKTWLVSRLVGLAWCSGYADGMTINHINGNHHDNRAINLEWVTLSENIKKGHTTGLFANIQKPVHLVGEESCIFFPSMAHASRFLGRSHGYVSDAIKKNRTVTDVSGNKYTVRM